MALGAGWPRAMTGVLWSSAGQMPWTLRVELTDLERHDLHKRIAEEYVQLEGLEKSSSEHPAEVIAAAEMLGKRTGGQSHV
jgi:hypothetical protein